MTATTLGDPSFPQLLRYHRLRAGLTQRALADLSTVSPRTIRDLESGRANARTQTIRLLADGLRLGGTMRDLFVRTSLSRRGINPFPGEPGGRAADPFPRSAFEPTGGHPVAPAHGGWARGPFDAIVGRDAEAAALADVLTSGRRRMIALSGLPGAGKTRLATEIAERVATTNGWTVLWARGPLDAILGRGDELRHHLGRTEALLVVDGMPERTAAAVVEELLTHCPGLRVLATYRVPWRVAGAQVAVVEPLAVPTVGADGPSVRLLLERLAEIRPGFTVTPRELEAVVRLCRRVDGLPLAIEVVARRGRVLSLPQLAELPTEDLLDLSVPGRTGTLGEILAGALDGLAPAPLALLRDLARPQRVWSVAEAATVLGRPLDRTIDGLDTLIGHGLVQASHGTPVTELHVPNLVRAVLHRADRTTPTAQPAVAR